MSLLADAVIRSLLTITQAALPKDSDLKDKPLGGLWRYSSHWIAIFIQPAPSMTIGNLVDVLWAIWDFASEGGAVSTNLAVERNGRVIATGFISHVSD